MQANYISELPREIMRYVKGTRDFGVKFIRSKEFKLVGFSDNDWGGSISDMRSTSGYLFTLGSSVYTLCKRITSQSC